MITLTREEAQQVLDALDGHSVYKVEAAIEFLRARLSAPEPEPSAWAVQEGDNLHDVFLFKDEADEMCNLKGDHAKAIPLYTASPQREWQGLTDEEMFDCLAQTDGEAKRLPLGFKWFAEAIEAKLKEKNT